MALRHPIPPKTLHDQLRASDPALTAWVSANAGSGKTHVLTQRVIRMLLDGVPPSKILCLTFTKAAAANMSLRVFDTLAKWTSLDDAALEAEIRKTGAPFTAERLSFARRLFARTVETPGGLKIQTIHAFCERLLHLFPFEANVASHFRVIEDEEQAELIKLARDEVLTEAGLDADSPLAQSLALISGKTNADDFNTLLRDMLGKRESLMRMMESCGGDPGRYYERLRSALGISTNRTSAELEESLVEGGLDSGSWLDLAARLDQGSTTDKNAAAALRAAFHATGSRRREHYCMVFLTKEMTPRAKVINKPLAQSDPALEALLNAEQARLVTVLETRKAVDCLDQSSALIRLSQAIVQRYALAKQMRGLLDFEDLIEIVRRLLLHTSPGWVLFKLDSGIDHILVDEAQDTSPAQWHILKALAEEFMAGQGQRDLTRTFFAVGDEKQSIYSFQGADPAEFEKMRQHFETQCRNAELDFALVPLQLSFRSAPGILRAVDAVFANEINRKGLTSDHVATVHSALKHDLPSVVELWPRIEGRDSEAERDWQLPLDVKDKFDPATILAKRIAFVISRWLSPHSPERVSDEYGRARHIRAGDIMILVRRRNAFFDSVIRALKEVDVPVAGADRLQLLDSIAVLDLMAAGKVALLPEDDLSLACVLKSPLIGFNDDDLMALAPERKGSLFDALAQSQNARHQKAYARLCLWRERAQSGGPFHFYAHLLGEDGGRRAIQKRLGPEARDAMDEFLKLALDHEQRHEPSLQSFLHDLQDISIKRDMEAASNSVRVLTVHAAKGLESKIVLLPDTCRSKNAQHEPKLYSLPAVPEPLIVWSPSSSADPAEVSKLRDAGRDREVEEYRRLFYVAMTRAEERLYIMGYHGTQKPEDNSWYFMAERTLKELMEPQPALWDPSEEVLRLSDGAPLIEADDDEQPQISEPDLPLWLKEPAPREAPVVAPIRPSSALDTADMEPQSEEARAFRAHALQAGRMTHELLQHLGNMQATHRHGAAQRYIARRGASLPEDLRARVMREVFNVLEEPSLAPLFAPGSRAEVSLGGDIIINGKERPILGQIDRLAESEDCVLIADFKTGKVAEGALPVAYAAQLALYRLALQQIDRDKKVRAFLVWTAGPRIDEITPEMAEAALAAL